METSLNISSLIHQIIKLSICCSRRRFVHGTRETAQEIIPQSRNTERQLLRQTKQTLEQNYSLLTATGSSAATKDIDICAVIYALSSRINLAHAPLTPWQELTQFGAPSL